jgi:hypothetical protein
MRSSDEILNTPEDSVQGKGVVQDQYSFESYDVMERDNCDSARLVKL